MLNPTRRGFVKGCLLTAAATGAARRLPAANASDPDILVLVFLRGAMDGLNLLPPLSGEDRTRYQAARPTLQIPVSGDGAALPLEKGFGLHPAASPLLPIFEDGRLAIVHATGMNDPTRSHFEAQDFIELGTPGNKSVADGWLRRHLASAPNLPSEILIPALAAGFMQPVSLLGNTETLTLNGTEYFTFSTGPWLWQEPQRASMRSLYAGASSQVHDAGLQTMNAVDIVEAYVTDDYIPSGGAVYPATDVGSRFKLVAQMLKAELGTKVVTIDIDGWDTHESQGAGSGGFFANLIGSLSASIAAFDTDIAASGLGGGVTVVVMTEFGRRVDENGDGGTDHGHAAPMLLLGDNVIGGLHGEWPGLAPADLFEGLDVEVTTDFRRVLSEVLIRRLGNPELATVFPGYSGYQPLGIVYGEDLPPNPGADIRRPAGRIGAGSP